MLAFCLLSFAYSYRVVGKILFCVILLYNCLTTAFIVLWSSYRAVIETVFTTNIQCSFYFHKYNDELLRSYSHVEFSPVLLLFHNVLIVMFKMDQSLGPFEHFTLI